MSAIINYLVLPKTVSPTERAHVEKINRVALYAFFAHIPIFAGVAWMCDTGPIFAVALSVLTLIGPTLAYFTLKSHRSIACVFAFTAMCMGGLLVHFGQGPMQIEMHFYFFVLLALLATYGNPVVNLVAAVTAAVHHLALWLLLPASIFNYEASVWVVAVHAFFVVVETVAAVFIARSFYDNVIGLEKIVEARTKEVEEKNRAMRLVLDHVAQGLMTIDLYGNVGPERSRVTTEWFGEFPASGRFTDWIRSFDDKAATWLEIGLEELREDILPREVIIAQLPGEMTKTVTDGKRTFSLAFQPIEDGDGRLEKLLVVISDITEELRRAEVEAQQRENLRLFELIASDASGFDEFYTEASKMVRCVVEETEMPIKEFKRIIHTLKGNTAIFGLEGFSKKCHVLEDMMESSGERPTAEELTTIEESWATIAAKVDELTGGDKQNQVLIQRADLEALTGAISAGHDHVRLAQRVERLSLEPSEKRLGVLAEQARKIAARLGRDNVEVENAADLDLRFEPSKWASFWSSLVHVFRNAVDHGLESESERTEQGKDVHGHLGLRTYLREDGKFVLEIKDDGRGIDLDRLAEKAEQLGHEVSSRNALLEAIFADGLSTKATISETSGRGVGMSAVKAETEALGGNVEVDTEPGRGTRFSFVFPEELVSRPEGN